MQGDVNVDAAGLHGGTRLLGVDPSSGIAFRAQTARPVSQAKGLVISGQEYPYLSKKTARTPYGFWREAAERVANPVQTYLLHR